MPCKGEKYKSCKKETCWIDWLKSRTRWAKSFWAQDRTLAQNYQIFMGLGGGMASDGTRCFFCKTQPKLKIASPIWFSLLSTSDFRRWSSRAWERRARFAVADHQALSTVGASPLSGRCGTQVGFCHICFHRPLCFLILMNNRNQNDRFFIFSGCSYVPICSGLD